MNDRTKRIFLKPCPLCGSAPTRCHTQCDPWGDGAGYVNDVWFECSGCGYIKAPGCLDTYGNVDDKAKEKWNQMVDDIVDMIKERYS